MVAQVDMLDPVHHAPILANIEFVCEKARVQEKYLHQSMMEVCGPQEADFILNLRKNIKRGVNGLLLLGLSNPTERCQAMCGAILRNFIDARTITMNALIQQCKDGEPESPTVLLIPNLYVHSAGTSMASWQIQNVYDLLVGRAIQNKPTIAYVEKMAGLTTAYGTPFADFLKNFSIAS